MSQLPKEYQAIADAFAATGNYSAEQSVRNAVERCYALANKPVRELTDAEVGAIYDAMPGGPNKFCIKWGFRTFARELLSAHVRKQQEPETVKFRAAHKNGKVEMLQADLQLGKEFDWEWLDADGKPQEFEVKLP